MKHAGAPLGVADAAVVLLHGRGATATSILDLGDAFYTHGVALVAPQASHNRWYPDSFLAPRKRNEPDLSSALSTVEEVVTAVASHLPLNRIVVGGFSQGACLAAEYVARNPRRYGGLVVLSGGLIGPMGTTFEYTGDLDGTPVFVGSSDVDPYIPVERVHETRAVFERLGGRVTERIYENAAHTVTDDEVAFVGDLLASLVADSAGEPGHDAPAGDER